MLVAKVTSLLGGSSPSNFLSKPKEKLYPQTTADSSSEAKVTLSRQAYLGVCIAPARRMHFAG